MPETKEQVVKPTPGPWAVKFNGPAPEVRGDSKTAIVNWRGFDDSFRPIAEHRANARLIAAAPDLLRACKLVLETLAPADSAASVEHDLLAAVAKAEGR
jgi:hypothetical protein